MHLLGQTKLVAETKKNVLDSISELSAKVFTENKGIQNLEMSPASSKMERLDIVKIMQSIAHQGNGHIGIVEILKPINDKMFPTHSVEISFQGMNGTDMSSDSTLSYVRLAGSVQDPSRVFNDIEMLSKIAAKKTLEFAIASMIAKKKLSSKEGYHADYDDSGDVRIWNDKEHITLLNVIIRNKKRTYQNNQSHMVDVLLLNSDCYKIKRN